MSIIVKNLWIIISIILLIYGIYQKIKYLCLEKACIFIADIEEYKDLTGEEKFKLVTKWIEEEFPIIFRIMIIRSVLEYVIQYAYDASSSYMKNYIKRKTGLNVSALLQKVKDEEQ